MLIISDVKLADVYRDSGIHTKVHTVYYLQRVEIVVSIMVRSIFLLIAFPLGIELPHPLLLLGAHVFIQKWVYHYHPKQRRWLSGESFS